MQTELTDRLQSIANYVDGNVGIAVNSSPLGAAILIDRLYSDPLFLAYSTMDSVRRYLDECETGTDRIAAPLKDKKGVTIGHKTDSGYRDNGRLIAHNDVAYIRLPDNRHYSLTVFISNFYGTEKETSNITAGISSLVYDYLANQRTK